MSRLVPKPLKTLFALSIAILLLSGCGLFEDEADPFVPKPSTLHPEADAFSQSQTRNYVWRESLRRGSTDSLLQQTTLQAEHVGDTLIDGSLLPSLSITALSYAGPAPAAVVTRLGLRPNQVALDTLAVPDPGPSLRFPVTPALGWRLDTLSGDLRFVRVLDDIETLNLLGKRQECWAFAESTFQSDGTLLGTGTTWMGPTGLVRHRSEWRDFSPTTASAGSLFREITAK